MIKDSTQICPLCQQQNNRLFHQDKYRKYFQCLNCELIFVPPNYHLSEADEKAIYDYHENEELQVKDYNNAFKGKYADQGGLKYLYTLFPEGPVNMITQLAGIPAVKSVMNDSSGTVQ